MNYQTQMDFEVVVHMRRMFYGKVSNHKGFMLSQLADHLGMSRATVYNKVNAFTFTVDEMISTFHFLDRLHLLD